MSFQRIHCADAQLGSFLEQKIGDKKSPEDLEGG